MTCRPNGNGLLKGLLERDHYKRWDERSNLGGGWRNGSEAGQKHIDWFADYSLLQLCNKSIIASEVGCLQIWQPNARNVASCYPTIAERVHRIEQPSASIERRPAANRWI